MRGFCCVPHSFGFECNTLRAGIKNGLYVLLKWPFQLVKWRFELLRSKIAINRIKWDEKIESMVQWGEYGI